MIVYIHFGGLSRGLLKGGKYGSKHHYAVALGRVYVPARPGGQIRLDYRGAGYCGRAIRAADAVAAAGAGRGQMDQDRPGRRLLG